MDFFRHSMQVLDEVPMIWGSCFMVYTMQGVQRSFSTQETLGQTFNPDHRVISHPSQCLINNKLPTSDFVVFNNLTYNLKSESFHHAWPAIFSFNLIFSLTTLHPLTNQHILGEKARLFKPPTGDFPLHLLRHLRRPLPQSCQSCHLLGIRWLLWLLLYLLPLLLWLLWFISPRWCMPWL